MRTHGTSTGRRGWGSAVLAAILAASLAFALSLIVLEPAASATFDVHEGDELSVIVVADEILPNDDQAFLAAVERATRDDNEALVVLASPGGALGAGMHIGLIIREANLPTFVPDGEICASACALAWLAGAPRMMTERSEIGFHQPYDERDGRMVASIEANAVVGHYIATIGMGPEIVSFAVAAPPDQMGWLDLGTATTIGLDVVEVAAGQAPVPDIGKSMRLAGRPSPIDENAVAKPYAPLPVMRALTAVETANLRLTGSVDPIEALAGTPLADMDSAQVAPDRGVADGALTDGAVTVERIALTGFVPIDTPPADARGGAPATEVADPFAPLLLRGTDTFDATPYPHDRRPSGDRAQRRAVPVLPVDHGGHLVPPHAALPTNGDPEGRRNIESAVMAAIERYGRDGTVGLRRESNACWRAMRARPGAGRLQFCHVFDVTASAIVDPHEAMHFAYFAVEARLRAHREFVPDAEAVPAGMAEEWRADVALVTAELVAR